MNKTLLLVGALLIASCGGGSPLDGTWHTTLNSIGTAAVTLQFNSDGTVAVTVTQYSLGMTNCTGALQYTGASWASTATTLTTAGTPTCSSGSVTCTGGTSGTSTTITCPNSNNYSLALPSSCAYVITGDTATLSNCNTWLGNVILTR